MSDSREVRPKSPTLPTPTHMARNLNLVKKCMRLNFARAAPPTSPRRRSARPLSISPTPDRGFTNKIFRRLTEPPCGSNIGGLVGVALSFRMAGSSLDPDALFAIGRFLASPSEFLFKTPPSRFAGNKLERRLRGEIRAKIDLRRADI